MKKNNLSLTVIKLTSAAALLLFSAHCLSDDSKFKLVVSRNLSAEPYRVVLMQNLLTESSKSKSTQDMVFYAINKNPMMTENEILELDNTVTAMLSNNQNLHLNGFSKSLLSKQAKN